MTSIKQVALEVLPHFQKNILTGQVLSYGFYANAVGRNPAKDSMVIGHALHAIGAVCVFSEIPVAPLYFVALLMPGGAAYLRAMT